MERTRPVAPSGNWPDGAIDDPNQFARRPAPSGACRRRLGRGGTAAWRHGISRAASGNLDPATRHRQSGGAEPIRALRQRPAVAAAQGRGSRGRRSRERRRDPFQIIRVVRGRDEPGLVRRRWEVDPGVEHRVEEGRERHRRLTTGLRRSVRTSPAVKNTENRLPARCSRWGTPARGQRLRHQIADGHGRGLVQVRVHGRQYTRAAWPDRPPWRPGSRTACPPGRPVRAEPASP